MEEIRSVKRSKERAKISYNKLSGWYDFLITRSEKKFRDAGLAKLNVQEGEEVLEVGFGTGYCTQILAGSVGGSGKVYGLDISEGMLNVTASRLIKAGLSERVRLQCGDAADLPYRDHSFDAVFMSFTLELFDSAEIPIVLQELRRVLKGNGRLCVVAMSKEGKSGAMVKLYEWGHEKFPDYIDCRPIYTKQSLENANFKIMDAVKMSLLNVPVTIILAGK